MSGKVVPYIGTWIETLMSIAKGNVESVVPYIGTWIETAKYNIDYNKKNSRTLYRYVD